MKVRARFAFWQEGFADDEAPFASYMVLESDNPSIAVGSNLSGETLLNAGVPLPVTPTFETWVNMGRPIYRGEVAA